MQFLHESGSRTILDKKEEPIIEAQAIPNIEMPIARKDDRSFAEELIALKKSSKRPTRVPCMTHLMPDINAIIDDLVEKSRLSKSQVIEHLILKALGS
jgi:hypothetical protein